jgi:hypothetical protein
MAARDRYPVLVDPREVEDFDTALSALMSDRLAERVSIGDAVTIEEQIRTQRGRWLMRRGE